MFFSKNTQLILRHKKIFQKKRVFFLGNIQDNLPAYLPTIKTIVNFQKYNDYISFKNEKNIKNINIYSNALITPEMIKNCNAIIYYWPKNKAEAIFQIINIMSYLEIKTQIFIVGENNGGVKSAQLILKKWIELKKIDSAKHSILFLGILNNKITFVLEDFFKTHIWKNFSIHSLPGVFGYKKIDEGSKLLASTFSKNTHKKVLDIGSGTGFLSASFLYYSPKSILTLSDNHMTALECSRKTFHFNNLKGKITPSNLYSNIFNKFDLIISNPPFHEDLKINYNIIKQLICHSIKYLKFKGELRFVLNSFLNYDFLLKKTFKKYSIIEKTNKYKVYQSFIN